MQKLRLDPRTSITPIIAYSSDPSPARRDSCLKAGATEYLIRSTHSSDALESAVMRLLQTDRPTVPPQPIAKGDGSDGLFIVFLSAKGGTGTSSLCTNIAMNIRRAEPEARVVVADLVLPIGSIAQIAGYEGDVNFVTLAELPHSQTNREYLHQHLPNMELWNFQLLAGSPDPQHGNMLKGDRVVEIIDDLRSAYDFVVLDIGRSLSRISLPLIQKADLIAVILSTDLGTIRLTKTVLDYLRTQGIDEHKIFAILNRAVGLEGSTKSEAEAIIGLPIKTTMPYLGGNFALANNLHQPITVKYPTDTASIIFKDATGEIVRAARQVRSR
jgi:pilus assembly protein CpaE